MEFTNETQFCFRKWKLNSSFEGWKKCLLTYSFFLRKKHYVNFRKLETKFNLNHAVFVVMKYQSTFGRKIDFCNFFIFLLLDTIFLCSHETESFDWKCHMKMSNLTQMIAIKYFNQYSQIMLLPSPMCIQSQMMHTNYYEHHTYTENHDTEFTANIYHWYTSNQWPVYSVHIYSFSTRNYESRKHTYTLINKYTQKERREEKILWHRCTCLDIYRML